MNYIDVRRNFLSKLTRRIGISRHLSKGFFDYDKIIWINTGFKAGI